MRHLICITIAVLISVLANNTAFAQTHEYTFDPKHTEVRASWNHLGISRQSARFNDVSGTLRFNTQRPELSELNVTIKVASVTTGVEELDKALTTTPDFFNAEEFPDITFKNTKIAITTAKSANVTGFLTINGITKPAVLSVAWNFEGEHPLAKVNPVFQGIHVLGFSGRTTIRRSEWGITRTIPLVSDEVRILIEAELHRKN